MQRDEQGQRLPGGTVCKTPRRPMWLEYIYIYCVRKKGRTLLTCILSFIHYPSSRRQLNKGRRVSNSVCLELESPICILFWLLTDISNLTCPYRTINYQNPEVPLPTPFLSHLMALPSRQLFKSKPQKLFFFFSSLQHLTHQHVLSTFSGIYPK